MADEIRVTITEESPIQVTVEGGMGSFENIQSIIKDYLINESLSSSIEIAKVTFNPSFSFFTESLIVFVNGLKEKPVTVTENSFTLSMDLNTDDVLECQYIRK